MGGIFIAAGQTAERRRRLAATALEHFKRAGLSTPIRIETDDNLFDYYPKHAQAGRTLLRFEDGDFAMATGTLIFRGRTGADALHLFWNQRDHVAACDECLGHFTIVLRKHGKIVLLRDKHATFEIYHDRDHSLFSSSFLALASCLPRLSICPEASLEYIIGGVTLATHTPVTEIQRLNLGDSIVFGKATQVVHHPVPLVAAESTRSLHEQIEQSVDTLRTTIRAHLAAFNNKVRLSFSGGYDSRLLLALVRDLGVMPHLFVYGDRDSADVKYARQIAESEAVPFEHIDKLKIRPVTYDAFPEMLRNSYEMNDGFSQYWMFCSDSENYARIDRCQGDGVVMNGGGGEIFRNFFKFRGQSISVRDFVRCFFSGFDPAILADSKLKPRFEAQIGDKISKLLRLDRPLLDRAHVQSLYPHLRCRSWFGRDTSLDNRFGFRATPYLEPRVVNQALTVPLRWKHFGIFQGRMLCALDKKLACHMSSHGYSLDRDPPLRARLGDLQLYAEPMMLRRYNFRIKQALERKVNWPQTLSPHFLSSVLDPEFPIMSSLLHPARICDAGQFQRVCVLEYMYERLGVGGETMVHNAMASVN